MHPELFVRVSEARGLAVVLANLEEGRVRGKGPRNVGRGSSACADGYGTRCELEFALVEDLSVGTRLHSRRSKLARRIGVYPVLIVRVVPVEHLLETTCTARCRTSHSTATTGCDISGNSQVSEKRGVHRLPRWDTGARELQAVRAMQTHAVVFGLHMAGVHVEVKVGRVTGVVRIDITEKRPARASLVRVRVQQHTRVNRVVIPVDTVRVVINKALAGIELGAGLSIDYEDITAFDGGRGSGGSGHRAEGVFEGEFGRLEAGNETKLPYTRLGCGVRGHP